MSGAPAASVLIVADPDKVGELAAALSDPLPEHGPLDVLLSSGGDDTIDLFEERRPPVVVITSTFEAGDAKALIEALRGMSPRAEVAIVVIGDAAGPVRTVLDASELAPDRFVGRPVAPKALRFAVASALDMVDLARGRAAAIAARGNGAKAASGDATPAAVLRAGRSPDLSIAEGSGAVSGTPVDVDDGPTASTRAALRARWEALADSIGDDSFDGDDDMPAGEPAPLPPIVIGRPLEVAPPAAWQPGTTDPLGGVGVRAVIEREHTLIISGEPSAPWPNPNASPWTDPDGSPSWPGEDDDEDSVVVAERKADEVWSSPMPLAELIDQPPVDNVDGPEVTERTSSARDRSGSFERKERSSPNGRTDDLVERAVRVDRSDRADVLDVLEVQVTGTHHPLPRAAEAARTPIERPRRPVDDFDDEIVVGESRARRDLLDELTDDLPDDLPADLASDLASDLPPDLEVSRSDSSDEASDLPLDIAPRGVTDVPPEGGRDFARQLRAKMSMMAQRLFHGDAASSPSVDLRPRHDHHTEIDLASLGEEPALHVGATEIEARRSRGDLRDSRDPSHGRDSRDVRDAREARDRGPGTRDHESSDSRGPSSRDGAGGRDGDAGGSREAESGPRDGRDLRGSSLHARDNPSTSPGSWDTSAEHRRGLPDNGEIVSGLSDASLLLARMFAHAATGRVGFRRDDVDKIVFFDNGRPVFASSSDPRDRMGELLVREGKITAAQFERCQVQVAESGRRMGEILVDFGYMKRRELLPAVRRHVEDIVYSLFGWERGTYRLTLDPVASAERIRLSRHPASLILEGIRRKLDRTNLERLVGSATTVIEIADRDRMAATLNLGDLTAEERSSLQAFDGQADLTQVARVAGVDVTDVLPLAWGLCVLGLASARRMDAEISDEATALVGETDLAIDRERVLARWALVTDADYFALLGVRRDATTFEIRRAYQSARRDFAADCFPAELRRELAHELDDIAQVLDEAFRVLRDDRLRRTYLANLVE